MPLQKFTASRDDPHLSAVHPLPGFRQEKITNGSQPPGQPPGGCCRELLCRTRKPGSADEGTRVNSASFPLVAQEKPGSEFCKPLISGMCVNADSQGPLLGGGLSLPAGVGLRCAQPSLRPYIEGNAGSDILIAQEKLGSGMSGRGSIKPGVASNHDGIGDGTDPSWRRRTGSRDDASSRRSRRVQSALS